MFAASEYMGLTQSQEKDSNFGIKFSTVVFIVLSMITVVSNMYLKSSVHPTTPSRFTATRTGSKHKIFVTHSTHFTVFVGISSERTELQRFRLRS